MYILSPPSAAVLSFNLHARGPLCLQMVLWGMVFAYVVTMVRGGHWQFIAQNERQIKLGGTMLSALSLLVSTHLLHCLSFTGLCTTNGQHCCNCVISVLMITTQLQRMSTVQVQYPMDVPLTIPLVPRDRNCSGSVANILFLTCTVQRGGVELHVPLLALPISCYKLRVTSCEL